MKKRGAVALVLAGLATIAVWTVAVLRSDVEAAIVDRLSFGTAWILTVDAAPTMTAPKGSLALLTSGSSGVYYNTDGATAWSTLISLTQASGTTGSIAASSTGALDITGWFSLGQMAGMSILRTAGLSTQVRVRAYETAAARNADASFTGGRLIMSGDFGAGVDASTVKYGPVMESSGSAVRISWLYYDADGADTVWLNVSNGDLAEVGTFQIKVTGFEVPFT